MKSEKSLFAGLLVIMLLCLSGCQTFPILEVCLLGDAGLVCYDERLPKDKREYIRSFPESLNYICTNPDDYQTAKEWIMRKDK